MEEASRSEQDKNCYEISAAVLKIHEAKRFPGGLIASLAIPWGFVKGDDDLGGYHLVWPRDLVEAAGGLLAVGGLRSDIVFWRVPEGEPLEDTLAGRWLQVMNVSFSPDNRYLAIGSGFGEIQIWKRLD